MRVLIFRGLGKNAHAYGVQRSGTAFFSTTSPTFGHAVQPHFRTNRNHREYIRPVGFWGQWNWTERCLNRIGRQHVSPLGVDRGGRRRTERAGRGLLATGVEGCGVHWRLWRRIRRRAFLRQRRFRCCSRYQRRLVIDGCLQEPEHD